MFSEFPVTPTIPVGDLQKARDFYENKLGLIPDESMPDKGGLLFHAGKGTTLFIYQRPPTKAAHTLASFAVDDIEKVVDALIQKGVVFEQYDMPNGIKTDTKGIATMGKLKAAWFKDPDENILSILHISE